MVCDNDFNVNIPLIVQSFSLQRLTCTDADVSYRDIKMNASYNGSIDDKAVPMDYCEQVDDEMLIFKLEELYTLWFVPFCIIMVFGIIGNVITIVKIVHDKRLHNPTYCSICCLAGADFIGLIHFLSHIFLQLGKLDIGHNVGKVFLAMCFATTHASASHVVLLWSLRYLVTIHPLWRLKVTTKTRVISVPDSLELSTIF